MKKKLLLIGFAVVLLSIQNIFAQVAINDDGSAPNSNVMLDVKFSGSNVKGMLIPRVTTADRTGTFDDAFGASEDGLIVYDTDLHRFYYWDAGTSGWKELTIQGANWAILGNSGIDASNNFLGTTDANDLVFRTNNTECARITSDGKIGINTTTPDVYLHIYGDDVTNTSDDATYGNGTGLLVLGNVSARNLVIDQNEILARNNGASSTLYLQNRGGAVMVHYDRPITTHDDGSQFVIQDDGKVGIGFLSPEDMLHIYSDKPYIKFTDSDGGHKWNLGVNGGNTRFQIGEDDGTNYYPYRFVIKEGGYVGIGTVSPEGLLHIKANSGDDAVFLIDADAGADATDTWKLQSSASDNNLNFINDANTRVSITSSGYVGIGTASPAKPLHISGSLPYIRYEDTDGGNYWETGNRSGDFRFYEATDLRMVLENGGNVGIGTDNPDAKLHVVLSGTAMSQSIGTVACFQQNNASDDWARVSIIGGTTGASVLDFGDADKQNIGMLKYDHTDNYLSYSYNDGEILRIEDYGYVGIGTTNPTEVLDVNGAIRVGNTTNTNAGTIRWDGSNFQGYNGSAWVPLDVQTTSGGGWTDGGTNVYLTTSSDNVGIGTNSPTEKLEVNGNIKTSGNVQVGTEVNRSAQGNADLIPIAYGVIGYDASILSGSGNFTVTRAATGDFRITISGESFNSNDYTVVATARNTTAARIITVGDSSGDLRVRIWTSGGSATNNTFHFVVYKP